MTETKHPEPSARYKTLRLAAPAVLAVAILVASMAGARWPVRGKAATPAAAAEACPISVAAGECPSAMGKLLTFNLPSSPFPHPQRSSGYRVDGEDYGFEGHYDDSSVSVFAPAGYRPEGPTNLVLFFHGWLSSRAKTADEFSLLRQFKDSGARALLVIPETAKDSPDSFGGKLEERGGFERFVRDLLAALGREGIARRARPGRIVLAGHSGAYRVISAILARGGLSSRIEEVYLFDALFGGEDEFRDWISSRGKRFAYVLSEGGSTEDSAKDFAEALREIGIEAAWEEDDPAEDALALAPKVVFMASPSDHYGVVSDRNEFERLLESSRSIGRR